MYQKWVKKDIDDYYREEVAVNGLKSVLWEIVTIN